MDEIRYKPIGTIHSPFHEPKGMPIQPAGARGVSGTVVLADDFVPGLQDLEGFSHIILLYHLHLAPSCSLKVKPFLDTEERGLFATRAPARPNPIGLSVVRLTSVAWNILHIQNVDIVDGTPLLDVKPYIPQFDAQDAERIGWLTGKVDRLPRARDDARFTESPD